MMRTYLASGTRNMIRPRHAAVSVRSMATRVPIVGGNWKCNAGGGVSVADVETLVSGLNAAPDPKCETFIAPPSLYLMKVSGMAKPSLNVCAQNLYKETKGAYTGEISAEMLVDAGIKYTLVGHSERRDIFGEDENLLGAKIAHAQKVGMKVIACIGEHKEDREAGKTMDVLKPQLQTIVDNTLDWENMVIAYEPVWAIGTGLTATPQQAQETHANIRAWISTTVSTTVADSVRIQYGGSANEKNCQELGACEDIDGFLVGGACLKPDSFSTILSSFD